MRRSSCYVIYQIQSIGHYIIEDKILSNKMRHYQTLAKLPPGSKLDRKDWVTLNKSRTKVGKTKDNFHK